MNRARIELISQQLTMCREETLRVAGEVPEGDRFKQLKKGKAHPAWLVGHLANTVDSIVLTWSLAGEPRLSKEFKRQFAPDFVGGLPITADASDYPAWDAIIGSYQQTLDAAIAGIANLQDSDLSQPLKGQVPERLRERFTSIGRALSFMVLHDSYHRGQIGMLSKLNA